MAINQTILEGCIAHQAKSQELAYAHYYGYMLTVGMRYVDDVNDAKMLINESFFKAFTKIAQYNITIPFEIWIRRIMINTCIDYLRKNKKTKFNITLTNAVVSTTEAYLYTKNEADSNIETAYLTRLLNTVPETSRKAFYLFAVDGYSHKEIGQLLGISEGTSKWHISNARKILQQKINSTQPKLAQLYAS